MDMYGIDAKTLDSLRAQIADNAIQPTHNPAPSAKSCTSPIHLSGSTRTVNATTGELLHSFSTDDLTGQVVAVACGNRRESVWPPCSNVYAADAYQLIAAGLIGGKGVPTDVVDNPRVSSPPSPRPRSSRSTSDLARTAPHAAATPAATTPAATGHG